MISMKTGRIVCTDKLEDMRDTATKLNAMYSQSSTNYAYFKGWIHCHLQKEDKERQRCKTFENHIT